MKPKSKKRLIQTVCIFILLFNSPLIHAQAQIIDTPYQAEQNVIFDFYFDEPNKTASALYWLRSYLNPLMDHPYNYAPEFMNIKVIIHGTEIVTVAKKNYEKYKDIVERMKYYHALGVEFRVCALAADDYGYRAEDLQDFIVMVPSAMVELGHWQQQGYAIIKPTILLKTQSIEQLR